MRVLFLLKFPLFGNGSGQYTRQLAQQLAKQKGNTVAIATPDKRAISGVQTYTLNMTRPAVFEGHPEWPKAKSYSRLTSKEFLKIYQPIEAQICDIIEDFKPDVVHVNHAVYLTWVASFAKSFYGISFITTAHGTDLKLVEKDPRYKILTKQALERTEAIIAVGPHVKTWLLTTFGRRFLRKIKIIPPGINGSKFSRLPETASIDKKYGIKGKKLILFVGRLTKEKGVEYLVKAADKIKGEIFIIGDGPEKGRINSLCNKLDCKNVHLLGYFDEEKATELHKIYTRADVLVLPSVVNESLGLVLLEAMACYTPVVASNRGGIPLVVKERKNGMLVRARSPKAIAEAVNYILNNPDRAKAMAIEARKTAMEKFSMEVLVKQILPIYKKASDTTIRLQKNLSRRTRTVFDGR